MNLNSENVSCKIISKDKGILSGNEVACRVFQKIDKSIEYTEQTKDSETLNNGTVIANIFGDKNSILTAERTALNFLQRMSGVASITNEYVKLVKNISIFDTRKTIPGWRTLDKYAVKCGGGNNHRMNLGDGLLIKDNHISAANKQGISIKKLVEKSRNNSPKNLKIEIEVDSLDLLKEVVETNVDIIMLDNMTDKMIQKSALKDVFKGLNVGVRGSNLWLKTDDAYHGFDPEINSMGFGDYDPQNAMQAGTIPPPKTWSMFVSFAI